PQAVIRRVRRHGLGDPAVNGAPANIIEGFLDHFLSAAAGMIDIGKKIQRADRRIGEHENRIDEVVVLKIRRRLTAIDELAIPERAAVKCIALQFDALAGEGFILVEHRYAPDGGLIYIWTSSRGAVKGRP